jgi:hypothetical protein
LQSRPPTGFYPQGPEVFSEAGLRSVAQACPMSKTCGRSHVTTTTPSQSASQAFPR